MLVKSVVGSRTRRVLLLTKVLPQSVEFGRAGCQFVDFSEVAAMWFGGLQLTSRQIADLDQSV